MKLEVFLFISPACGLCPLVEQRLVEIIEKNNLPIKIKKIDVTEIPETSKKHDIIVCPTLVFPDFMKIDGVCDQVILEELTLNYYVNSFKFLQGSINTLPAH
jgi:galactitol-specific phosphotransferase system IIB component